MYYHIHIYIHIPYIWIYHRLDIVPTSLICVVFSQAMSRRLYLGGHDTHWALAMRWTPSNFMGKILGKWWSLPVLGVLNFQTSQRSGQKILGDIFFILRFRCLGTEIQNVQANSCHPKEADVRCFRGKWSPSLYGKPRKAGQWGIMTGD